MLHPKVLLFNIFHCTVWVRLPIIFWCDQGIQDGICMTNHNICFTVSENQEDMAGASE